MTVVLFAAAAAAAADSGVALLELMELMTDQSIV
jgi:hypothetical protein